MVNIEKVYRKILQLIVGFDKWHISPLKERPYAVDVISYCNNRLQRNDFAEIGCGLGDITRNVLYKKRRGFDNDEKVLKAARMLPVKDGKHADIQFKLFHFPDSHLDGTFNVLTLVNWIHHIEPVILKNNIAAYLDKNISSGGEILIDTVQDKEYRYNHNIDFLTRGMNCSVYKIGSYARQRELWAIKKLN